MKICTGSLVSQNKKVKTINHLYMIFTSIKYGKASLNYTVCFSKRAKVGYPTSSFF